MFGFDLLEVFPSGFALVPVTLVPLPSQYLCWSLMKVQKECGYHPIYSQESYFTEIPLVTEDSSLTLCSALWSTQGIKPDPNNKLEITF